MQTLEKKKIRTVEAPGGNFVTFAQMHAQYERRHRVKIDMRAEVRRIQAMARQGRRRQR